MNISKLSDDIVKGGIKEIFPLEEKNMSPFIAANILDFEEIIGKRIGDYELEKSVGRYEADIIANFIDEEGCLIIENKIGQFDHDHLGKALTYMSYLNGKVIIWICDKYYDEHIKAINYLNEITSDEYSFYAIELQLYKIDNNIKYKYNVIAKPDYIEKLLSKSNNDNDRIKSNKEFYNAFISILNKDKINFTPEPRGLGYGYTRNVYESVSLFCCVSSRNKEISIFFESKNEADIDNLTSKFNSNDFEKTYGKKNNSIVRLIYKDKPKYKNKPIECVNEAANKFINLLNTVSNL